MAGLVEGVQALRARQRAGDGPGVDAVREANPALAESADAEANTLLAAIALMRDDHQQANGHLPHADPDGLTTAEGLSDFGLLALLLGERERAGQFLRDALAAGDRHSVTYARLASVSLLRGDLNDARALYGLSLEGNPDSPEVLSNLGGIAMREARFADAAEFYRQALALRPGFETAFQGRIDARRSLGEVATYRAEKEREIAVQELNAKLVEQVAALHTADGQWGPGETILEQAVAIFPHDAALKWRHGWSLIHHGCYPDAASALATYIQQHPKDWSLRKLRLEALAYLGDTGVDSEAQSLVAVFGWHPDLDTLRAYRAWFTGSQETAVRLLENAVYYASGHFPSRVALGQALQKMGRHEEAAGFLGSIASVCPEALLGYARSRNDQPDADTYRRLTFSLYASALATQVQAKIGFDLARAHHYKGAYRSAAGILERVNALKRGEAYYDFRDDVGYLRDIVCHVSPDVFDRIGREQGHDSSGPLFVLGISGTGTDLLQKLLAHDPAVVTGQTNVILTMIARLMHRFMGEQIDAGYRYPAGVPWLDSSVLRAMGDDYLAKVLGDSQAASAWRVIDIAPVNIYLVGLAALIFPKARFAFIDRDARDIAFASYSRDYISSPTWGMSYAYDLRWIGQKIRVYRYLMDYWAALLPDRVYRLSYEETVASPNTALPELARFFDLSPSVSDYAKYVNDGQVNAWLDYADYLDFEQVDGGMADVRAILPLTPIEDLVQLSGGQASGVG